MSRCVSCFAPLPPLPFSFRCPDAACRPEPDPVAAAYQGVPVVVSRTIEIRPAEGVKSAPPAPACSTCRRQMIEVCPTCHYEVPGGAWRTASVTAVALAGPRSTGKSVYMAVAVKELARLALALGGVARPASAATDRIYAEKYEAHLFHERRLPGATPVSQTEGAHQREPMVWHLGQIAGRARYVVFRDVAGEELENQAKDNPSHLRFFGHADLIVHMYDPFALDEVRNLLHGRVSASGLADRPQPPASVLHTVMQTIASVGGRPHYALTMSKVDTLWQLRDIPGTSWAPVMGNLGAAMLRDSSVTQFATIEGGRLRFAPHDGEILSAEVRSMLLRLNAKELVSGLEQPTGVAIPARYFAVSALGEAPEADRPHPRGISPFRVLDPLLWVLRETWS